MTTTSKTSVKGLTLDTGALLALERGDSRVRALLRRALETGLPLSVPAGVVAQAWRGGPRQARVARLLADPSVHVAPLDDMTAACCADAADTGTSLTFTSPCWRRSRGTPW